MIAYVNALFAEGVLISCLDNSLVKELQQALKLIQAGKTSGAIENLNLFVAEVNDLLSSGTLSQPQAATLIGGANSLTATLSS